jgi:hypothetical protein
LKLVPQRGEHDCAHAALATVCEHSYEYVIGQFPLDQPMTDRQAIEYLLRHGFRVELRQGYARPFAPRHLMALREVVGEREGYGHYSVLLGDGRVLDPASATGHSVGGYPRRWEDFGKYISPAVQFVIGIWPPAKTLIPGQGPLIRSARSGPPGEQS